MHHNEIQADAVCSLIHTHMYVCIVYIYILQIVISTHTVFHCCTLHERMYIWGYFLYWLYGVSYFITVFFMQRFWIRLLTKWNRSSQRGITNVFFLQAAIWKVNTVTYTRPFYFAILSSFLVCQLLPYYFISLIYLTFVLWLLIMFSFFAGKLTNTIKMATSLVFKK